MKLEAIFALNFVTWMAEILLSFAKLLLANRTLSLRFHLLKCRWQKVCILQSKGNLFIDSLLNFIVRSCLNVVQIFFWVNVEIDWISEFRSIKLCLADFKSISSPDSPFVLINFKVNLINIVQIFLLEKPHFWLFIKINTFIDLKTFVVLFFGNCNLEVWHRIHLLRIDLTNFNLFYVIVNNQFLILFWV